MNVPAELVIAPYLPLSEVRNVDEWTLLPFPAVDAHDGMPGTVRQRVLTLVGAYEVASRGGSRLGAVAHCAGLSIAAPVDRQFARLGLALLVGTLNHNPSMADGQGEDGPERTGNEGHAVCTTENALLYGHPVVGDASSYVTQTGVLARSLGMHVAFDGTEIPKVQPSVELPGALLGRFDAEIAAAAYQALATEDEQARRLEVAVDWCRVALSNSERVSLPVRVGAARSAIETLMGTDDKMQVLNRHGRLMSELDAPTSSCSGYPYERDRRTGHRREALAGPANCAAQPTDTRQGGRRRTAGAPSSASAPAEGRAPSRKTTGHRSRA